MQNKLLCTFFQKTETDIILEYIKESFNPDRVFIFNNINDKYQFFCTFSIPEPKELINRIIVIHRKSDTNTFYTINAVNHIIKQMNNGKLVKNYPIDWSLYINTLLIYKLGSLEKIEFMLCDKIFY